MTPRELVGDRYTDALGLERIVPAATRETFIEALETAPSNAIAPPTRVLREGDPLTFDVTLAAEHWDEDLLWTVSDDRVFQDRVAACQIGMRAVRTPQRP